MSAFTVSELLELQLHSILSLRIHAFETRQIHKQVYIQFRIHIQRLCQSLLVQHRFQIRQQFSITHHITQVNHLRKGVFDSH